MLIAAAAKKWNVPVAEITAQDSMVKHAASGKTATYGSLANAAAKMPVPDPASLKLKTRAEYKLLGRRHRGVDDPKIVTGKPLFGSDVRLPGMTYANFVKCPAVGGKVRALGFSSRGAAGAGVRAEDIVLDGTGIRFMLHAGGQAHPVRSPLLGRFNVDNLLGVATTLFALGMAALVCFGWRDIRASLRDPRTAWLPPRRRWLITALGPGMMLAAALPEVWWGGLALAHVPQ